MAKKLDILESHTMRFLLQGEERKKLIAHFQEVFPVREKINLVEVEFAMSQKETFYNLLDQFAKENGYSLPPREEKLTFGDLKVGELFIQFPITGSAFLKEFVTYEKIYPTKTGKNTKRASGNSIFLTFSSDIPVLKIC